MSSLLDGFNRMIPNSGKQAGLATHHGVSSWTLPGVLDLYFWEAAWEEKSSSKRVFFESSGKAGEKQTNHELPRQW